MPNWTDSRVDREGRYTPRDVDAKMIEGLSRDEIAAQIAAQRNRRDNAGTMSSFINRPKRTVEQTLGNYNETLTEEQAAAAKLLQAKLKAMQGDQTGYWTNNPGSGWTFTPSDGTGFSIDTENPRAGTRPPGPSTTEEWSGVDPVEPNDIPPDIDEQAYPDENMDPVEPNDIPPDINEDVFPDENMDISDINQSFTYNGTHYAYEPSDGTWWVTTYDQYHQPQTFQYPTGPSHDPNFTGDPLKDLTFQLGNDGYWNFDDQGNATFTPNGPSRGFPEDTTENGFDEPFMTGILEYDGGGDEQWTPDSITDAGGLPLPMRQVEGGFTPIGQTDQGAAAGLGGLGPLSGVARDSSANNWYQDEGFRKWMQENVGEEVVRGIDQYYGYDVPEGGRPLDGIQSLHSDDVSTRGFADSGEGTIRSAPQGGFPSNPSWWEEDDDEEEKGAANSTYTDSEGNGSNSVNPTSNAVESDVEETTGTPEEPDKVMSS